MHRPGENIKLKVTFIFPGPYPKGKVSPRRAHLLARGLAENGFNVLMLITEATENRGKVFNPLPYGVYEGVNYEYIGGKTIRDPNYLVRNLRKTRCHFSLLFNLLINKYKTDFYIILGCSFDYRILIPIILSLKRSKVFLEINEYPLVNQSNLIAHIKRWILFNLIFPYFNGFMPISKALEDLILKFKSRSARSIVIPIIGCEPIGNETNYNRRPIINDYIFHAGSLIEQKDGILGMIEAFGIAKKQLDSKIKYVFTGMLENTPDKEEIEKKINNYDLGKHVVFTGYLSDNELDLYLRHASLAIINKKRNLQNNYCFASKIAEYTAYEIPIILTNVGDIDLYFRDGINSIIVDEGQTQALAEAIISVFKNQVNGFKIGSQGRLIFESNFNYKIQGRRLKQFMIDLID